MTRTAIALLAGVLLPACASQANTVRKSGFLEDYSRLKPGGPGDPLLYYVLPDLDLAKYDKIQIEPITIRASSKDALKSVPKAELDNLVKLFYDAVCAELGSVKQIVSSPGPGTLRLRLAITEALGSDVGDEVVSTIHPVGLLSNLGSLMATGTQAWASMASIEGELTDSMSKQVLVEFCDRRQGGNGLDSGQWTETEKALRFWAVAMRQKVQELSS